MKVKQADEKLNRVWDVLVKHCGADESQREYFLASADPKVTREWRFMGALGFGGKIWLNPEMEKPYVNCYREDETPARTKMIAAANAELEKLFP